jgi:hypothetical protein
LGETPFEAVIENVTDVGWVMVATDGLTLMVAVPVLLTVPIVSQLGRAVVGSTGAREMVVATG